MRSCFLNHPVFAAALGLALGSSASGQLAAKSPFMPPQSAAAAGPTAGAPLEYRGYLETSEGMQFRIYDPAKKSGAWVKLNEKNAEFDVMAKQHDGGQKTLTIEYQGKALTLAERESKVVSSGAAGAAMPPPVVAPVPSNVPAAVTQAVVLNPTPADEQRRLDAVAAEVARRRALREQAAQGSNPTVTIPQPVQQLQQIQQAMPPQRAQTQAPQGNYPQPAQGTSRGRVPPPNAR